KGGEGPRRQRAQPGQGGRREGRGRVREGPARGSRSHRRVEVTPHADHHRRVTIEVERPGEREELSGPRPVRDAGAPASVSQRRFVIGFLASCLGLLTAVLALNVVIDPFAIAGSGIVPTAVESDRSIKLTLLESLKRGPEILILGSSRSRQAEPSYLGQLTGHTGFNAGVTGGTSADEWVFVRFA